MECHIYETNHSRRPEKSSAYLGNQCHKCFPQERNHIAFPLAHIFPESVPAFCWEYNVESTFPPQFHGLEPALQEGR